MVAAEQRPLLGQRVADMIGGVAGRRHAFQFEAVAGNLHAVMDDDIGSEIMIVRFIHRPFLRTAKARRGDAIDFRIAPHLQRGSGWRMIAVGMGHQDLADLARAQRALQGVYVLRQRRAGIDHRDLAARAHQVNPGAFEREGTGVGRQHTRHTR